MDKFVLLALLGFTSAVDLSRKSSIIQENNLMQ